MLKFELAVLGEQGQLLNYDKFITPLNIENYLENYSIHRKFICIFFLLKDNEGFILL